MGVYYSHYLISRDSDFRPEPSRVIALIEVWLERKFIIPRESPPTDKERAWLGTQWQHPPHFKTDWPAGTEPPRAPEPEIRPGFWARLLGRTPPRPRPDPWLLFSTPPVGQSLSALANPYTVIQWNGHPDATYPMRTLTQSMCDGGTPDPHRLVLELSDDFVNPHPGSYGPADGTEVRTIEPVCACGHDLARPDEASGWLGERIHRICPACGRVFQPEDQIADIVHGYDGSKTPRPGGLCNRFGIIINFDKDHPMYDASTREYINREAEVTPLFMQTCRAALGVDLVELGYYS